MEKDIFFFELYKTGELTAKVNELKHSDLDKVISMFNNIKNINIYLTIKI